MGKGEKIIVIEILDDKDAASADEIDDHILCLEAARSHLEVEWTEALGALGARQLHKVFGYPSVIAYLKHRCGMAGGRAHRYVSVARAARRFRSTFLSWKYGQISTDQAQQLFRVSEQMPDRYPDAEAVLLEIVGDTPEETRQILDYWRHSVDKAGMVIDEELQLQRRRLDVSRKANGMVTGSFEMTSLAGETLMTALDALIPPPGDTDTRTPSQRRHDALEDLSRSFLEGTLISRGRWRETTPQHSRRPKRPRRPGGRSPRNRDGACSNSRRCQLACDSSLHRLVMNGESEIIDVGRRTRVIPSALRRAVIARDRHCTYKGCDRPAR